MGKTNENSLLQTITETKKIMVYNNTTEEHIRINESKARLIYRDNFSKNNQGTLALTFLGLFITCLIATLTSNFKPLFNIELFKYLLLCLFIIATVLFAFLTIIFTVKWNKNRKRYNEDNFIKALKNQDYGESK